MNKAERQKTALVLCGGGNRGAAEVGFYQALCELEIHIDFIVGTSVGAVNGVYIACGLKPIEIKKLWLDFCKWRPFRFNWEVLWKGLKAQAILDPRGFQKFLEDTLPVKQFESLKVPLTIVATDLQNAEAVYFERGNLVPAIMASAALPLYFPPVLLNGHQIVDGGASNNVPLDVAVRKGATRVYAMLCGCQEELKQPVCGFLNIQSRAFHITSHQKLCWDLEILKGKVELMVLEPYPRSVKNVLDFSQTEEIIEEAYQFAKSEIPRRISVIETRPSKES